MIPSAKASCNLLILIALRQGLNHEGGMSKDLGPLIGRLAFIATWPSPGVLSVPGCRGVELK